MGVRLTTSSSAPPPPADRACYNLDFYEVIVVAKKAMRQWGELRSRGRDLSNRNLLTVNDLSSEEEATEESAVRIA
jgi:hypothetical protein